MSSAVVSRWEYCEQASPCKPLKTIHYALVSSKDERAFVVVKERFHSVWSELHDVARPIRIANEVWLDAKLVIWVCRVTPQDVDNQLLFNCWNFMHHLEWPFDLFDLLQRNKRWPNSSMQTNNPVLDDSCERQPIEELIDLLINRVMVIWVFAQTVWALLSKAKRVIDPFVFVVAA